MLQGAIGAKQAQPSSGTEIHSKKKTTGGQPGKVLSLCAKNKSMFRIPRFDNDAIMPESDLIEKALIADFAEKILSKK